MFLILTKYLYHNYVSFFIFLEQCMFPVAPHPADILMVIGVQSKKMQKKARSISPVVHTTSHMVSATSSLGCKIVVVDVTNSRSDFTLTLFKVCLGELNKPIHSEVIIYYIYYLFDFQLRTCKNGTL